MQKHLGHLAIDNGLFTTESLIGESIKDIFGESSVAKASVAKAVAPVSAVDEKEVALALDQAEDEDDRLAAQLASKEQKMELVEFDESQPLVEDGPDGAAVPSSSETDMSTEEETQRELETQLEQLRGIERHALSVLERYTAPLHQQRMASARQALEEQNKQMRDLESRIRTATEEMASEDEEEVFYDKDEAYRAYLANSPSLTLYEPPQPLDDESLDAIYVDPRQARQYHVAYMLFTPLPTRPTHRSLPPKVVKKLMRRKGQSEWTSVVLDSSSSNPNSKESRATKGAEAGEVVLPHYSIFRKRDEDRIVKDARNFKRLFRALPGGKADRRVDGDSNRDGPAWAIDEDFELSNAVDTYKTSSGAINWNLVAELVNLKSSLAAGRYRSRLQCRDRYFNDLVPPDDSGKVDMSPDDKKKKRQQVSSNPLRLKTNKIALVQQQYEQDQRQSTQRFHTTLFTSMLAQASRRPAVTMYHPYRHDRCLPQPASLRAGPEPVELSKARIDREAKEAVHHQQQLKVQQEMQQQQQHQQHLQHQQQQQQQLQQQQQQQQQLKQQQSLQQPQPILQPMHPQVHPAPAPHQTFLQPPPSLLSSPSPSSSLTSMTSISIPHASQTGPGFGSVMPRSTLTLPSLTTRSPSSFVPGQPPSLSMPFLQRPLHPVGQLRLTYDQITKLNVEQATAAARNIFQNPAMDESQKVCLTSIIHLCLSHVCRCKS
jgi:hypothetical protein